MKNTITLTSLVLTLGFFGLSSLKTKSSSTKSFDKFLKKSSYTLIPAGIAFVSGEEKSVAAFYISKGEVTNFQYKEFLRYLKQNDELEKLKICQIDTANWMSQLKYSNKPYAQYYHSHPAYNNYPVVNISYEAAQLYCAFVSEALSKSFPGITVACRLPSYIEYVRAARGDHELIPYGWGSHSVRNTKGQVLGNFMRIGEECITRNPVTDQLEVSSGDCTKARFYNVAGLSADILALSESYWPNQFGVFNLSGNVAEMIDEKGVAVGGSWRSPGHDVRIDSKRDYNKSDIAIGFRVVFTYVNQSK